jgi:hypothetical protein
MWGYFGESVKLFKIVIMCEEKLDVEKFIISRTVYSSREISY